MCLNIILETKPKPEGAGYKAFRVREGSDKLYGEFASMNKPRPVGRWLDATDYTPHKTEAGDMKKRQYPTGWHVFKTRRGIEEWMSCDYSNCYTIRKIKYRLAHTKGSYCICKYNSKRKLTPRAYKQIVATEIYIIPLLSNAL